MIAPDAPMIASDEGQSESAAFLSVRPAVSAARYRGLHLAIDVRKKALQTVPGELDRLNHRPWAKTRPLKRRQSLSPALKNTGPLFYPCITGRECGRADCGQFDRAAPQHSTTCPDRGGRPTRTHRYSDQWQPSAETD